MKLSSKTHYGLMACHVLANNYQNSLVSASALQKSVGVSGKYLEQIMRKLSSRNIVLATRGAQGGYSLANSPENIKVGEIVRALEDDMEIIECVKTDAKCKCCPTSAVWKKLYASINEVLDNITLEQMINGQVD